MAQSANRPTHPPLPDPPLIRRAWLAALAQRLGPLPTPVLDAADRLVTSLDEPGRTTQALTWFASTLGAAGWDLGTVTGLIDLLAGLLAEAGAPRPDLTSFPAGAVAGRGWAHGYLPVVTSDSCTDSLTGLATLGVLAWRLRQVYGQCGALGVDAPRLYALVVLDVVRTGSVLARDVARVAAADLTRRRFDAGETVVAAGNRLLVLTSRTHTLEDDAEVFADEVRAHPALASATVLAWVEPLPATIDVIDRWLHDVV
jgi:hypothetical protein